MPSPRAAPGLVFDLLRREIVLFGGNEDYGSYDDTWTWDGRSWRLAASGRPLARHSMAVAFDASELRTVMYGGRTCVIDLCGDDSDTWAWNGRTWTRLERYGELGARCCSAMVFEAHRARDLLFGGNDSFGVYHDDTWAWNRGWTVLDPASEAKPAPRSFHGMAYDAGRRQTLLFGGYGCPPTGCATLGDTWLWDGTAWVEVPTDRAPSPRSGVAMAYDGARGEVVLFGGEGCGSNCGDTWTWDGTGWTRERTLSSPRARNLASMAYDAVRQEVVLFGGSGCVNYWCGDTWAWNGTRWRQVA